jgi:hypothetical protein
VGLAIHAYANMAERKNPKAKLVPERDWFEQMWHNLHTAAANARETNALPTHETRA